MKRFLFFLISLLIIATGFSQVTPNYPQKPATPTAFKHLMADSVLWLPYGGTPRLREPAATTRPGALFVVVTTTDTTLMLWTGERWVNIAGTTQASALQNELIFGGTVTPLGGSDFFVQEAIYRIDNVIFQTPDDTVTISASDPTLNRLDRIYLSEDQSGAHVLEGEFAVNALEPQVDGDQIGLAFISIPAASTEPTLVTQKVYDDNLGESGIVPTGTTTDPDNTTNVYIGTKSLNVTNINDPSSTIGDFIIFTKTTGVWSVLGFDGFSLFIKLKAVMAGAANLRIQLIASGVAVSSEVIIPINKSNITTYQGITISAAAFGNITNTSVTGVRIRYTRPGNTANYTGFYLDNMFFVDGVSQQPTGNVIITLIPPVGFLNSPSNTITNTGTITTTPNGLGFDYYSPSGWANFPDFITTIGTLDGRTKSADGAVIDGVELFLQTVDADDPGLMTSAMFNKLDSNYYITNSGDGDTLAWPLAVNITAIKSLKGTGGITINPTDTTIVIDGAGAGGGGGRFGFSGEDDAAAEARLFSIPATFSLEIHADEDGGIVLHKDGGGGDWSMDIIFDNQNLLLNTTSLVGNANIVLGNSEIHFESATGHYEFLDLADDGTATKVVVYNTTNDQIGTVDIAGLGGGGAAWGSITGTLSDQTDLQTALNLKAPLASPTFTGTVTIPTPFTLGATSVTSTGTQLNYLNAATGTTGTASSNLVFSATPTFSGTTTITTLSVTGFSTQASGISTNGTAGNANFYATGGITANRTTTAAYLPESAAGLGLRVGINGSTAYTMTASDAYSTAAIASTSITEAASGTHPLISGLVVKAPTVTNAAGATANMATLYIDAAPSGVTPTGDSYALWVKAGNTMLTNGNLSLGTAGNKINITTGSNASVGVSGAMTGGTITISTTAVTASSIIILTHATLGGTQGILSVGTITAGTSFVINSSSGTDTGTVNWWIIN